MNVFKWQNFCFIYLMLHYAKLEDVSLFPRFEPILLQKIYRPDATFERITENRGLIFVGNGMAVIKFIAFRKKFDLILIKQRNLMTIADSEATVVTIFGPNNSTETQKMSAFDANYYVGRVRGVWNAKAEGYIIDHLFNGVIRLQSEGKNFFVESVPKGLIVPPSANAIIYRETDALQSVCKNRDPKYCVMNGIRGLRGRKSSACQRKFERPKRNIEEDDNVTNDDISKANGTAIPTRRICNLLVAIDSSFSNHFENDRSKTVAEVVYPLVLANAIFLAQDFNGDDVPDGIGLSISKIVIHNHHHYTIHKKGHLVDASKLLEAFSRDLDYNEYCLAILFVSVGLAPYGTVGLAYMGHSNSYEEDGGICSPMANYRDFGWARFNTVVLTNGRVATGIIPRAVMAMATTHLLGHSFGSTHDQDMEGDCDKLMSKFHRASLSSSDALTFSRCSLDEMNPVIKKKGTCLTEQSEDSVCGNGITELGEECDCGSEESCYFNDRCCVPSGNPNECAVDSSKGYECSPFTNQCCSDFCHFATMADAISCQVGHIECGWKGNCTGESECNISNAEVAPVGIPCNKGSMTCDGMGHCNVSKCSAIGKKECECQFPPIAQCRYCCLRKDNNGKETCEAIEWQENLDKSPFKPEGASCASGKGTCNPWGTCHVGTALSENMVDRIVVGIANFELSPKKELLIDNWIFALLLIIAVAFIIVTIFGYVRIKRKINELRGFTEAILYAKSMLRQSLEFRLAPDFIVDAGSRIAALFPTVPKYEIVQSLLYFNTEVEVVTFLLNKGYPMRIDFSRDVDFAKAVRL